MPLLSCPRASAGSRIKVTQANAAGKRRRVSMFRRCSPQTETCGTTLFPSGSVSQRPHMWKSASHRRVPYLVSRQNLPPSCSPRTPLHLLVCRSWTPVAAQCATASVLEPHCLPQLNTSRGPVTRLAVCNCQCARTGSNDLRRPDYHWDSNTEKSRNSCTMSSVDLGAYGIITKWKNWHGPAISITRSQIVNHICCAQLKILKITLLMLSLK